MSPRRAGSPGQTGHLGGAVVTIAGPGDESAR